MKFTYECGDIYEHGWGDTVYCTKPLGHDGDHYGKPAGDRNPNAQWTDDDPRRRANKDSASRAIAGGAPAPPSG